MKTALSAAFVALFMGIISTTFAQESVVVRDLQTWSSIGVQYKASKKVSLTLDQEFRLWKNSSIADQVLTEAGVAFKPVKFLELGMHYRYLNDYDHNDSDIDKLQRWDFNLGLKHKINRLTINYRLRYQRKDERGLSSEEGDIATKNLRNRVGLSYNIKDIKHTPYASFELFREFSESQSGSFNKIRFTVGSKYKINKSHRLKLFYRYEREFDDYYPSTTNVVGVNYRFIIKRK